MINRCNNPNDPRYHDYGGRGIKVCCRWLMFYDFLEDMGERPPGKILDRINNSLGYSKANCKWSTPSEQQRNMRSNRNITWKGKTQCLRDWSNELGIHYNTLRHRLKRWPIEVAMTEPTYPTRKHGLDKSNQKRALSYLQKGQLVSGKPQNTTDHLHAGDQPKDEAVSGRPDGMDTPTGPVSETTGTEGGTSAPTDNQLPSSNGAVG